MDRLAEMTKYVREKNIERYRKLLKRDEFSLNRFPKPGDL